MPRALPEWIGKTPDTPVPDRVKLRVFERFDGRCHITGVKITPPKDRWDVEHVKPLALGGENRESNLAPALKEPHKAKTKAERKVKAKADSARKKHLGIKRSRNPLPGSKASGWRKPMNSPAVRR